MNTKEEAEKKMTEQEYDFEWIELADGTFDCRIASKVLPAIRVSTNGRQAFYNQVIAAYTGWIDSRNAYG